MSVRTEGIAEALAGRPALMRDACARALAYLDGLADRPVAPAAADVAALRRLDFALPEAAWTHPGPRRVRGGQTSSRMPAMISTLAAGVAASMQTRSITRR